MYYRVAIQVDSSSNLEWKSSALSSLDALFQWLRYDHLRVFSCASREEMDEQLMREMKGLSSTSLTAAQFLEERGICSPKVCQGTSERRVQGDEKMVPIAFTTISSLIEISRAAQAASERGMSALDRRRIELEYGVGGDHDVPYTFSLPASWPLVLAWMKLLAKIHSGELQP